MFLLVSSVAFRVRNGGGEKKKCSNPELKQNAILRENPPIGV